MCKLLRSSLVVLFFILSSQLFSQSFTSLWNTANISVGSSGANEIRIPTNSAYTYSYTVDWGDGNIDSNVTGDITHTYATQGTYTVKIEGTFPAIYFNNTGDVNKIIEILSWGTIQWQSMENAFYGCSNLNFDAITPPDLSQVTSLQNAFRGCSLFNGIMNNWNMGTITNISGLFMDCEIFNRPLDQWDTSSIIDMSYTFYNAREFNEPLDNWNTSAVTTLENFLYRARKFNQNINNWNVANVVNMEGAFYYTSAYNQPMNNWNVGNVTNTNNTFKGSSFNSPIDNWDVSSVTTMAGMFSQSKFNHPLNSWNVSDVTDMSRLFFRNRTFNQPLDNWDVSNVISMSGMFDGWAWGAVFNQPIGNWNVSNVTDMSYMFRDNSGFNQLIGNWDVSNVVTMRGMFEGAIAFNRDISLWNISKVTNVESMFERTEAFNQTLNTWDVSNITNMRNIFQRAEAFNQPLNTWDVSNVTSFQYMFDRATSFNQDITGWETGNVRNMSYMFNQATSFNQNIGVWDISKVTNMTNMLSNSGISQENYDNILIAWDGQTVKSNVNLGATSLNYCDALNQRQSLIDDNAWVITGDIVNCSYVLCTQITMPQDGDTQVPANSDIRWNPAPNATGYRISVRRENGGSTQVIYNNEDVGNVVGVDFTNEFIAGDTVYVTVVPYNDEGPATGCQEISFTVVESWANSPEAFKLTYDTSIQVLSYTSPTNQLEIETDSGYPKYLTYNYSIDWGDGQYDHNVTGNITHTYLSPGIYTVSIIGVFPSPKHKYVGDSHKLLSIDQWGTQVWGSMYEAFEGCGNMEYKATDIPNLSSVMDMEEMFSSCRSFNGNINNWDVSNVTNMSRMFVGAAIYNQPLNNWDVSNATNMNSMFSSASKFNQDIGNWNTRNVTDMGRMFQSATVFNQNINNSGEALFIESNMLFVFQKGLAQGYQGANYLVYKVEVTNALDVREFIFVNAHSGEIVEQFTGIAHALDRVIYENDTSNVAWQEGDALPGTLTIWQRNEVEASGHVYHFFNNAFGFASYDGADAQMQTINNNPNINCPNASWNGVTANYCDGTAADDVIAHEWGHAYTQFTSGLIYQWQSGAINESYSDIWGETVDLLNNYEDTDDDNSIRTNGCGSSDRWRIAEDATAFSSAIRDMWDPTCNGDPGKVTDAEYLCGTADNGGVHINSGIPNHAYALLVDGGNYNGQVIIGIGFTKAAHIFWRAQSQYLTATSDFVNLADALEASANDLLGVNLEGLSTTSTPVGPSGEIITPADVQQVINAILAVELRVNPDACGYTPVLVDTAPLCDNANNNPIFFEDWENGIGNWTLSQDQTAGTWTARDWEIETSLPNGRTGSGIYAINAPIGAPQYGGDCASDFQNGIMRLQSPVITLPDFTDGNFELAFNHYISIEPSWDGGNIKMSINGGTWDIIPSTAFTANPYNGTLNGPGQNDNPMAGENVFTGTDEGSNKGSWGTSIIDLGSLGVLANDTIQFRFEMGTDGCNGREGWYLDEFRVYNCAYALSVSEFENLESYVTVYPNPSNGIFTLQNKKPTTLVNAKVYDINGRLIKTINLSNMASEKIIDLSEFSSGLYFMSVASQTSTTVIKLLKQ